MVEMSEIAYKDLSDGLSRTVRKMNDERGLIGFVKGVEYKIKKKSYDEFVCHREDIVVTYSSIVEEISNEGLPVIAIIHANPSRDGLDGSISSDDGKKIRDSVHSFSHKYGITTGDLLD